MKFILIVFSLAFCLQSFSQQKKSYYFTEGSKRISEEEFKSKKYLDKYVFNLYEVDTAKVFVAYERKQYGKLDTKTFKELVGFLQKESKSNLLTEVNIVINYLAPIPIEDYSSDGKESEWNIFHRNYLKNLSKAGNFSQYWVAHPDQKSLKYYHGDRIQWIIDSESLVEQKFFPHLFHYGSFVIINHEGTYIKYYGAYGEQTVVEVAEEINKL